MGHEIDKTKVGACTFYSWHEMSQKTRLNFCYHTPRFGERTTYCHKRKKNIKTMAREVDRTVAL